MPINLSGSLVLTGSLAVTGEITMSGSIASASYAVNATSASFAGDTVLFANRTSATFANTGSNTFSGGQYLSSSFNPTGFSTTASLYTDGGLRVTRDAYISGTLYLNNVTVYGTQSVAYISSSQLNIGTNIISVNTDIPSVRFGGLAVYDSGSTGLTGSILWDSQDNQWIYSNPSGSTYDSAMFLVGPRNTGALGGEVGIGCNFLSKGNGMHHMTSSAIFEDGSRTCFYGNSFITNTGAACFTSVCSSTFIGGTVSGTTSTFASGIISGTPANSSSLLLENFNGDQTATTLRLKSGRSDVFHHMQAFSGNTSEVFRIEASGRVVSAAGACFAGNVCIPSAALSGNVVFNRANTSAGNNIEWRTANTLNWYIGTRGLVNNNFYIVNEGLSTNNLILDATTGATTINTTSTTALSVQSTGTASGLQLRNTGGTTSDWIIQSDGGVCTGQAALRFYSITASAYRMSIDGSGNVSIGTISPSSTYGTLTVAGTGISIADDGNAKLQIGRFNSSACNAYIKMGTNACALLITNNLDTADLFTIQKGGNIGIGTTNPGAKLTICGVTISQSVSALDINAAGSGTYQRGIRVLNGSMGTGDSIIIQAGRNDDIRNAGQMTFNYFGSGCTSNFLEFGLYAVDKVLNITGTANVGIGTSTPTAKLHTISCIDGFVGRFTGGSSSNVTAGIYAHSSLGFASIGVQSAHSFRIFTNDADRLSVTSGGNVGVGITDPTALLQVRGPNATGTFFDAQNDGAAGATFARVNASSFPFNQYTFLNGTMYIGTNSNPLSNAQPLLGILAGANTDAVSIRHTQNGNNTLNIWQTGTATFSAIAFYKGDAQILQGTISVSTSAVTYGSVSDYRLKENVVPLSNGLDRLMQLKPSKFNWISTGEEAEGFIAHEVQEVYPGAVTGKKDAIYSSTGNIKPQSVDYGRITPLLVKAIQEQQCTINTLKTCLGII